MEFYVYIDGRRIRNSTYTMIERFLLLETKIRMIVKEDVALLTNYSSEELFILKDALEVLEPIKLITTVSYYNLPTI